MNLRKLLYASVVAIGIGLWVYNDSKVEYTTRPEPPSVELIIHAYRDILNTKNEREIERVEEEYTEQYMRELRYMGERTDKEIARYEMRVRIAEMVGFVYGKGFPVPECVLKHYRSVEGFDRGMEAADVR